MAPDVLHLVIACGFGVSIIVIATILSRRGLLSFRYTMGWYAIGTVGIIAALLIPLVEPLARFLSLSGAAVVLAIALILIIGISIQLTISISGLQKQVQVLALDLARLRFSIDSEE
jgi:hypothetical protein